jgi:predicted PurR-regulated permease PerM
MSQTGAVRPFTKRVWLVVAIVTAVTLALAALTSLLTGMLVLFAGALFGIFLNQASRGLAQLTSLPYGVALGIAVFVLLTLAGGTAYFMGSRISQQAVEFSTQFDQASEQLRARLEQQEWLQWLNRQAGRGRQSLVPSNILSKAGTTVLTAASVIGGVILVAFLGFYFALQPDKYHAGIVALFPPQARPRAVEVLHQIAKSLWWWCLGRLAAMVLIGIGSAVGLWIIGIPLPATLGVMAGLLNFIPNLGPLIASIPPLLFGLQQGAATALYVAGFYLVLQFVESYFVTPLIDQQQVNLPPALVLSAQLLAGMLAGLLGLLLATPLAAAIFILVREVYVKDVLENRA